MPQLFDERNADWADLRERVRGLLTYDQWAAARRTTINAHYTNPAYIRPMWSTLTRLGFDSGRVLEPGSGVGTFIGLAPEGASMTGVELDPISAELSAALYPQADIRAESFADTRFPDGWFDAAIGNVPFADVVLHDPSHNRGGHSIHNHFLIKSLALVRPGGLAVFLTSRYTMDAGNPAARRELNAMADLLGAVRLPGGAHRRAAGTDVVTDMLVLRRRTDGESVRESAWETVGAHKVDDVVVHTNNYFHDHPENVLGTYSVGHGMYGEQTLNVVGDLDNLDEAVGSALDRVVAGAAAAGLTQAPRADRDQLNREQGRVAAPDEAQWEGHLTAESGRFTILSSGIHEPLDVPRTQANELRALIGLRDAAKGLLRLEASTLDDTHEIDALRASLKAQYHAYAATYGPLNRVTLRSTGRVDPASGEERMARVRPRVMQFFRLDPFAPLVFALENYDEATSSAMPATIMTQRVVAPRAPVLGADTPAEALAITLDDVGHVDLPRVAHLLGVDEAEARVQLGQLVYDDPASGRLLSAAEYLSGNIATRLDAARAAAERDDAYQVNVAALEDVLPAPLGADEITPRVGAAWIDAATHQQFLREILDDQYVTVEHGGGSMWDVDGGKYSLAATSHWGTDRMPAGAIFKAMLEQKVIQVTDQVDERRVLNPTATEAAREKQAALQERFETWVWEDPARAERLAGVYNRTFNSIVLRDYSAEGARLTLPGLVRTFTPRPHQRTAVARMISEPAVGLFHEVGAGKTAEMVMGAMELKRLGMVSKPAIVVPNHMLEQFSREWLQLYPQARILAASSDDLARERRRTFVARAATGDWDAIIMTRGAFERVPVSGATQSAYMTAELDELRRQLDRISANSTGRGTTIKRLEKKIAADEERLKAKLDGVQDVGLTFEETGIDYLVVDEAHEYKNLRTVSNIPDAAIDGSQRASDLHMKLEYLRGRHGERVVTVATATPIANSVTEAHVMQRYLRPDLLEAAGVRDFDSWAATFGQTVTEIEMGVAGGFKQKTRFARFQNVPEMLRMWHTSADVRTAEDLQLPVPDLAVRPDGSRGAQNVVLEPSEELVSYVENLGERAEMVRARVVDSSTDNMLLISSDGRKAALDMRLTGAPRAPGNKIEAAATRIAAIWRENADRIYRDATTGEPAPLPGALQIVFSDLGTPRDGWNVYDGLRDQLVAHGVPRGAVRFIHEAKNDAEKGRLFAACRSGQVAVLVGSTSKMGVGTNIQDRAVALHHLDCPWRPADLQQRDGRILRQGNQNPEVAIYRWVVERSFDAYSWQTVERKAKFIAQIMRGRLDVREIEDIGDTALSFGEVKALSSGNPLVMEREQAATDVLRLERLERAWQQNRSNLNRTVMSAQTTLAATERDIPRLEDAVEALQPTAGEAFRMTVHGAPTVDSRADAGRHITDWVRANAQRLMAARRDADAPLGLVATIGGHEITAAARAASMGRPTALVLSIADVPRTTWAIPVDEIDATGVGIVRQIENHVAKIPATLEAARGERERAARAVQDASTALTEPFKHTQALADARRHLADIEAQMTPVDDVRAAVPAAPDAGPAPTAHLDAINDLARRAEHAKERAAARTQQRHHEQARNHQDAAVPGFER